MFATNVFILFGVTLAIVSAVPYRGYGRSGPSQVPLAGGFTPTDLNEAKILLSDSLVKLAAAGGPSYSVDKVKSASSQVIAGTNTVINAKLIELASGRKKNCDVAIAQLVDGTGKITLKCRGDAEVVKDISA